MIWEGPIALYNDIKTISFLRGMYKKQCTQCTFVIWCHLSTPHLYRAVYLPFCCQRYTTLVTSLFTSMIHVKLNGKCWKCTKIKKIPIYLLSLITLTTYCLSCPTRFFSPWWHICLSGMSLLLLFLSCYVSCKVLFGNDF